MLSKEIQSKINVEKKAVAMLKNLPIVSTSRDSTQSSYQKPDMMAFYTKRDILSLFIMKQMH